MGCAAKETPSLRCKGWLVYSLFTKRAVVSSDSRSHNKPLKCSTRSCFEQPCVQYSGYSFKYPRYQSSSRQNVYSNSPTVSLYLTNTNSPHACDPYSPRKLLSVQYRNPARSSLVRGRRCRCL